MPNLKPMKQSDDPKAFYEKYQFTLSTQMKHPVYGDVMHFEGLEADYVSRLERELEHFKKTCMEVMCSNERLLSREHYRLQDELKKLKADK